MGIIPLFPQLPAEMSQRVRQLFDKVETKQASEAALIEFMDTMMGEVFSHLVVSRVKRYFDEQLPPLVGNKLAFYPAGFGPWVLEVVSTPRVLSFRLPLEDDKDLPGIRGDFDVIRQILLGMEVTTGIMVLDEDRLGLMNTDRHQPISWMRELFLLVGPILDRKDVREDAIAKSETVILQELQRHGC
ncbi:MAG: hypothetical protein SVY53_09375 [Chloroflexota bacterium]|nr:hypothetical protein [Chloroflexota bacterium]